MRKKVIAIVVITILGLIVILSVASVWTYVNWPKIYAPPALTCRNLAAYRACIEFLREHDDQKNPCDFIAPESLEGSDIVREGFEVPDLRFAHEDLDESGDPACGDHGIEGCERRGQDRR